MLVLVLSVTLPMLVLVQAQSGGEVVALVGIVGVVEPEC